MKVLSITELVSHAKKNSEFYRNLYESIDPSHFELKDLPLIHLKDFWMNNQINNNKVLTAPLTDGIVFKSGGTTGNPKFSVFSRQEWHLFTHYFGQGMGKKALSPGDRVANLFYAGDLYSSFLFIHGSLEKSEAPTVNYPISGTVQPAHLAELISDHSLNVLAGVPTTILNYTESFRKSNLKLTSVQKILFGGESLYTDQRNFLKEVFPGVEIISIGYASVDGGLLGFADSTCEPDEHRCFSEATIMELIDENGQVIEDLNTPGELYLTNLTRSLMPIIRYPAGDRALWKEPWGPHRKYQLLGRSEEAARVGPVSLYVEDVSKILKQYQPLLGIQAFQLILEHSASKDSLTLRIAASNFKGQERMEDQILASLYVERPMLQELTEKKFINPTRIELTSFDKLETNPRTGKLKRVIDKRFNV